MLYHWYELNHAAVRPWRAAANLHRLALLNPFNPLTHTHLGKNAVAAFEVFERVTRRYGKPPFDITSTVIDDVEVPVVEEVVWRQPFCELLAFRCDSDSVDLDDRPNILIAAPMSGHFASLLRGTVEALLPTFNVYITDWADARDVPVIAGKFELDDYIDYMLAMLEYFGGDVHVYAVCQPSVPVLAAVSLLESDRNTAAPRSMILTGGPIDTRINPTVVNQLAEQRGTEWFAQNVITTVPWPNAGFGRAVYPGFLQLSGFMTMNLDRHVNAHKNYFDHLVEGDGDFAEKHRAFYDDYLAVMDLTEEFYLETVDTVFVRHLLPKGEMRHRGRQIVPRAIGRTALMTIEGEKDDISGVGQCAAAHDLCTGLKTSKKEDFVCPDVGHYGLFNGSRFRTRIAPRMSDFVFRNDPRDGTYIPMTRTAPKDNTKKNGFGANAFTFGNPPG